MSTTTSTVTVDDLITWACDRNTPIELHYEPNNAPMVVGRARLLGFDDKQLLADRPLCLDTGTIPCGKRLSVHISMNGERYEFESFIEESHRMVQLNAHNRVRGIALKRPLEFSKSQRRKNLRISLMGYEPITVELVKPHPDIPAACPADAMIYNGWMVDLSVGGMSVLMDQHIIQRIKENELFYVTFDLPGGDEETGSEAGYCLLGSVRHSRVIEASESLRVAMSFQEWNQRQLTHDQRRLSRFIASHERRMLRRRR